MRTFLALIVFSLLCETATAASIYTTLNECWVNNSPTQMNQCVTSRATTAKANLFAAEEAIRQAIVKAKNKKDPKYLARVKKDFEASVKSYAKYRQDQCSLNLTLASEGNSASDNQRACEAELDVNRTEQLQALMSWLDI